MSEVTVVEDMSAQWAVTEALPPPLPALPPAVGAYYTLPFAIALLVLWALTVVLTVTVISVLAYRRFCNRRGRRFTVLGKTNISTISVDSDVLLTRSTEDVSTVF